MEDSVPVDAQGVTGIPRGVETPRPRAPGDTALVPPQTHAADVAGWLPFEVRPPEEGASRSRETDGPPPPLLAPEVPR